MTLYQHSVETPIGWLRVHAEGGAIVRLDWTDSRDPNESDDPLLTAAAEQISAYFAGVLKDFDLPLAPAGTAHDRAVWREMQAIGYGATRSYGDIARAIGSAPRAVGGACGRNPIPVIIPCHRILTSDGKIGGYSGSGGRSTKHHLLALEGCMIAL